LAHKLSADQKRFMTSGWATTVGVVGWSIEGWHGPMAPSKGLGIDNLLEVELLTADGNLIRANSTPYSDLYWALRGGGGSTWGVITAIATPALKISDGGFSVWTGIWNWEKKR
jgi:ribonuclease T2